MAIQVKVTIGNDRTMKGFFKYRFATKSAEDVGQFDHANSIDDIRDAVGTDDIQLIDWETGDEIAHLSEL